MHFEKVSYTQFAKDVIKLYDGKISSDEYLYRMYENIQLPKRSTEGSAGYDFYIPFTIEIFKGTSIIIPTGIRAVDMPINTALLLFPRSGQGFKYRLSLANTAGVIDSDYAFADNSGHIMVKLCYDGFNFTTEILDSSLIDSKGIVRLSTYKGGPDPNAIPLDSFIVLNSGDRFCQGIFTNCIFTDDDESNNKRTGGFGSTSNQ